MSNVRVHLKERSYDIHIEPELFDAVCPAAKILSPLISAKKVLLVSDSTVAPLYAESVLAALKQSGVSGCFLHVFPAGESSKTFSTVETICRKAVQCGLDRHSVIAGLGGGVTGDMAAFAASIYMRGIDFIQIPTSLLAMIDSGVGGKTGVDLPEGKNLIGTFYQPKVVLMDTSFLTTLPKSELCCGYAELIKHAVILDPKLFGLLEENSASLLALSDLDLLSELVAHSCGIKARVVAKDEREGGLRAILNYGHSFGHAIEKVKNFTGISHGAAVAVGMCIAGNLAYSAGLAKKQMVERQENLIRAFDLPRDVVKCPAQQVFEAMGGDKKNLNGKRRLVLPRRIGKVELCTEIPEILILDAIGKHCHD